VRNKSNRLRRLSATGYIEWVLGEQRPKSMMHVITEMDPNLGALSARNAYNADFGERIALTIDDIEQPDMVIPLVDDRKKHKVDLTIHIAQK
jgi:cellobiose phosphorylase